MFVQLYLSFINLYWIEADFLKKGLFLTNMYFYRNWLT
jgi:hypothetical protein